MLSMFLLSEQFGWTPDEIERQPAPVVEAYLHMAALVEDKRKREREREAVKLRQKR